MSIHNSATLRGPLLGISFLVLSLKKPCYSCGPIILTHVISLEFGKTGNLGHLKLFRT